MQKNIQLDEKSFKEIKKVDSKDFVVDETPINFFANLHCLLSKKKKDINYILEAGDIEEYEVDLLKDTNTIKIELTHNIFEEERVVKMFIEMGLDEKKHLVLKFLRDEETMDSLLFYKLVNFIKDRFKSVA